MSTVFGVPPPPRPTVVEAVAPAPPGQAGRTVIIRDDADRWRRRGVLALTLLAVTFLVLANVATWLHLRGLDPAASAPPAAEASLARAQAEARLVAVPALTDAVTEYYESIGQAPPATFSADALAAVDAAVESPAFAALWEDAVRQALELKVAEVDGSSSPATDGDAVSAEFVDVDLASIAPIANEAMAADGYAFLAGETDNLGRYAVPLPETEALPFGVLRALDSWWWLLLVAGVVLAGAAVVLARRRLRLGAVLAADLALGLGLTLIAVAMGTLLVGGYVSDEQYRELTQDVYGGLTRSLVLQTLVLLVLALVAAITCAVLARRERPAPPA